MENINKELSHIQKTNENLGKLFHENTENNNKNINKNESISEESEKEIDEINNKIRSNIV